METKTFDLIETKADAQTGSFTALASVFGNVDHVGDRMMPGSFSKTLAKWRASGDPIPVILSHKWDDPWAMVGKADPRSVYEDAKGLVVQGQLDMENPLAKQVHKLMSSGLLKGWSFGYTVPDGGQERKNGANQISEVDLVEVGPTLKGANPEAQLQAVKSGLLKADEINWAVKEIESQMGESFPLRDEARAEKADSQTPTDIRSSLNALLRLLSDQNDPREQQARQIVERLLGMMPQMMGGQSDEPDTKATWDTAYINNLPDSAFLYIESGGSKDSEGKTTPRNLRHFPYKDASGNVDLAHLRNALARIPQSNLPQDVKDRVSARARSLLDNTSTASATDGIEGGKAEVPRPRDPLRDKFDRILLGLE